VRVARSSHQHVSADGVVRHTFSHGPYSESRPADDRGATSADQPFHLADPAAADDRNGDGRSASAASVRGKCCATNPIVTSPGLPPCGGRRVHSSCTEQRACRPRTPSGSPLLSHACPDS
jgi:hypothetical protein